jgi:hypothetical protein
LQGKEIENYFRDARYHLSTEELVVVVGGLYCGGYCTEGGKEVRIGEACKHGWAKEIAKGFEKLVHVKT